MAKAKHARLAFNRGLVSDLAVARTDIKRIALAAETMTNWEPRVLGPMSIRTGTRYRGTVAGYSRFIPFIFSNSDTAQIEITNGQIRVWKANALITRPTVSTTILNPTFSTGAVDNWTDHDESGGVSTYDAVYFNALQLLGDGTAAAIREQAVTVAAGDQNVVHSVTIVVSYGKCRVTVGTTAGGTDLFSEATLLPGTHSIAFTPTTGTFYLRLSSREDYPTVVDSATIGSAGVMAVPAPWTTSTQLDTLCYEQSGDVVFVMCDGVSPRRIERRDNDSWSVVTHRPNDGPFLAANTEETYTLAPGALSGRTTLTAAHPTFEAGHVGTVFRVVSTGQNTSVTLSAQNTFSDPIRVTGVSAERAFTRIIGTITGATTVTMQRSIGALGLWTDVSAVTAGTVSYNDTFDNQIIYYRIGIKTGDYGGATPVTVEINYATGTKTGLCEILGITSSTVAVISVLTHFGSTTASYDWSEGAWSTKRGFPSSVALHDARLWTAGKDHQWASVVDSYSSHDVDYAGDAGPISRSIGSGPVDTINWLLSLSNLIMGALGATHVTRSSSLGEPITPTNYNLRPGDTLGSAPVQAAKVDTHGLFIDASGSRLIELSNTGGNYESADLTTLVPDLFSNATHIAVQRRPDTRIHVVSGGKLYTLVRDIAEEVSCWCMLETGDANAAVESVHVLPPARGEKEAHVYLVVKRVIDGNTVRYLEERVWRDEADGGTVNVLSDSSIEYSGASTTSITGLDHLEGETVTVWANNDDAGEFVVASGAITLTTAATYAAVGLPYTATFISTKLSETSDTLGETLRPDHLTLLLKNTYWQGLQYGTEAGYLDDLPLVEDGVITADGTLHSYYDKGPLEVNGSFSTDARLHLTASSPKACTVLAVIVSEDR